MAKRKRKPGDRQGFKLNLSQDYRSERYAIYLANAETGILQAATIEPDLTDGDVNEALVDLIAQLEQPDLAELLLAQKADKPQSGEPKTEGNHTFIQHLILLNLHSSFERHGALAAEDVIGILNVIKASVKRWGVGRHRRGYITFLEGFLGAMGVKVQKLSDDEAQALGLEADETLYLGKGD